MPYASDKQRKWMHAAKPEMAARWDKEEEKMASDIKLKKNIEDGTDEIDKFVRGGVLSDLIKEMTDGQFGPVMMKIQVSKAEPMEIEMEEEEDDDELGKKLSKMAAE